MPNSGIELLFHGKNFARLMDGLYVTFYISLVSCALAVLLGIIFGFIFTSRNRVVRGICKSYLEIVRMAPTLVLLFLFYFGLARFMDINLSAETAAIVVFSLWGMAEMGDIVRGAVMSIPQHQFTSGLALGATRTRLYISIIIPQAVRRMLPPTVNLITRIIKTTPLVVFIGIVEVLKVSQQIIEISAVDCPTAAFWLYGFDAIVFFLICYLLSLFSKYLHRKCNV